MTYFPQAPYDYGCHGRIGVATPQANPTVEAEFSVLFPRTVSLQASRLVCPDPDPATRLRTYIRQLDEALESYGGMQLTAFGFACTGSSYLVGAAEERQISGDLSDRFGYPVVTAAQAIRDVLNTLKARRIALVSPYPEWLSDAARAYWTGSGFDVAQVLQVPTRTVNTETIYELASSDAQPLLQDVDAEDVDLVLISGTGMPTLSAVRDASTSVPVVSSNMCLAWKLVQSAGLEQFLTPGQPPFISGWCDRLDEAARMPS
jgi:maleate isomerase